MFYQHKACLTLLLNIQITAVLKHLPCKKRLLSFDFKMKLTVLICLVKRGLIYRKISRAAVFKGNAEGLAIHNNKYFFVVLCVAHIDSESDERSTSAHDKFEVLTNGKLWLVTGIVKSFESDALTAVIYECNSNITQSVLHCVSPM